MNYQDFLANGGAPVMSSLDKDRAQILVVESDATTRNTFKQTLASLGYPSVWDAPNHAMALQKLAERPITHVIFEAKKSTMPASEFLTAVLACDEKIIALPSSSEPSVDDVFNLLVIGARGFIVKPFAGDTLDSSIAMATKGEPLSEAILYAKNRNEALVSLAMSNLDRLAQTMKQARQFETAQRELGKKVMGFKRAVELAKTFAQGGEEKLAQAILDFCLERQNGPATRLGRLRKRLGDRKGVKVPRPTEAANSSNKETSATEDQAQDQADGSADASALPNS
ncbi:MAG: hypothetical protein K1X79_02590 [Oligoflexia bacterium]|nr:hypothetical protein [Oligoflexia bacterium]